MHETYEYRMIRIKPRTWPSVSRQLTTIGVETVQRGGGALYGLWVGQIGMASNEGVVMTDWPNAQAAAHKSSVVVHGIDEIVDSRGERLVATVRPRTPFPPSRPGIYAHRWFELKEPDWPEFLALSEQAWPVLEATWEMEIIGFWQSVDVAAPHVRVLLMTWYASLAMWELSRGINARTPEEVAQWKRFERRHELTTMTIVATTLLATATTSPMPEFESSRVVPEH